ncbi:hypothetical protein Tco_0852238, partial [Tanacetum coccineum]
YALTVNPKIYTSCIQQIWATTKVKTVNGEVQLQALVDEKKVIITKTSVKRDLQLEDAEGIACLPNADIFEQLALMGAGCYNYGIRAARLSPVEPRFGEEVLIFCLRVRSLRCLFVKGAYGCILEQDVTIMVLKPGYALYNLGYDLLANYKLERDALNWWKAFKQAKGGETYVATLSWKDFRDIFFLQYFPRSEQEKYDREYHTIQ